MSNQPPPRPWFRLATLARAQAQAPAQPQPTQTQTQTQPPAAPPPRAPIFRPAFRSTAPAPQPPPPRAAVPPPSAARAPAPPPSASVPPPRSPPSSSAPPPPPPQSPAPRAAAPSPSAASPPARSPPGSPAPPQPQPQSPVPRAAVPPPLAVSLPPQSPPASPAPPPPKATSPLATLSPSKTPQKSPSPPPTPSPAPSPALPKASPVVTKPREPSLSGKVEEAPPSMQGAFMIDKKALPTKASNGSPQAPRVITTRILSTPPESPKMKPSAVAPPSPFALPPSQLKSYGGERELNNNIPPEAEKKTVLVQETLPKPKPSSESPMYAKPKGRENFHWKSSDEEEGGMRVITIAGENRGAVMELGYSPRRRTIKSDKEAELSGNEARSKMEQATAKPALPMNAFMNSNVQGVNSSILFNSSCSHHDPGVHFSLSRKPFNNGGHAAHGVRHSNGKNISEKENGKWFSS